MTAFLLTLALVLGGAFTFMSCTDDKTGIRGVSAIDDTDDVATNDPGTNATNTNRPPQEGPDDSAFPYPPAYEKVYAIFADHYGLDNQHFPYDVTGKLAIWENSVGFTDDAYDAAPHDRLLSLEVAVAGTGNPVWWGFGWAMLSPSWVKGSIDLSAFAGGTLSFWVKNDTPETLTNFSISMERYPGGSGNIMLKKNANTIGFDYTNTNWQRLTVTLPTTADMNNVFVLFGIGNATNSQGNPQTGSFATSSIFHVDQVLFLKEGTVF